MPTGKLLSTNVSFYHGRTHDHRVITDTGINTHLVYRLVLPTYRLPSEKLK